VSKARVKKREMVSSRIEKRENNMYNAKRLRRVLRIIVERGLQFGEHLQVKHTMQNPSEPAPPFKFHLCTPDLRPEARMTESDIDELALLLRDFALAKNFAIPGIAGVPRAGTVLARRLQLFLRMKGVSIPRVTLEKDENGNCLVTHTGGYREGPVWIVDDVVNRGLTKEWVWQTLEAHDYQTEAVLAVLDYNMGAAAHLGSLGIRLHAPIAVDSVFAFAECGMSSASTLSAEQLHLAREYLARERARLRSSR